MTIKLTTTSGREVTCSALLERDPGFLKWNRIALIGNRADYGAASCLHGGANVRWELHNNPEWGIEGQRTYGVAAVQLIGLTTGKAIALDSIQKFGDIRIIDYCEHTPLECKSSRIRFLFLQRPRDWYAYPPRIGRAIGSVQHGRWHEVAGTGLQLRLLTDVMARDDRRLSNEIELLQLPGVEMRPCGDLTSDAFVERAKELWFSLRILIAFRFRQYASTLATSIRTPGRYGEEWHALKVEPRETDGGHTDPPFFGAVDEFFARASASLHTLKPHSETLHAAAFGYANSYTAPAYENRLTNCVEAIERLITAFEAASSMNRELVERKEWRKIAESLKRAVDDLKLSADLSRPIKQSLTAPAALTLEDRVHRMADAQKNHWRSRDRQLLGGVGQMIKARNAIVHGRLVGDVDLLYVELVRAQALFERLFLNFLHCPDFGPSGYPLDIISYNDRKLASSKPDEA